MLRMRTPPKAGFPAKLEAVDLGSRPVVEELDGGASRFGRGALFCAGFLAGGVLFDLLRTRLGTAGAGGATLGAPRFGGQLVAEFLALAALRVDGDTHIEGLVALQAQAIRQRLTTGSDREVVGRFAQRVVPLQNRGSGR